MSASFTGCTGAPQATMDLALAVLRDRLAPGLASLIYNPCIPDRPLAVLLAWADALAAEDPSAALELEELAKVLPALNVAFLSTFTFAGVPPHDPALRGRKVDLELTDRGGGRLVDQVRTCARLLAVGLHSDAGAALVGRADRELRDAMDSASQAIARLR